MSQWGNNDDAANSVNWAVSQINLPISTTNQTNLFGNTTANVFISGATVGQFGVDTTEQQAMSNFSAAPPHAGWVLRTEGSGSRAGRVFYETLVAMGSMAGDDEDTILPDYRLIIGTNPSANTGNSTLDQIVTFTAAATTQPSGGTITYQWYQSTDGGATWATANGESGYYDDATSVLSVWSNTVASTTNVRALIAVTGGATQNTTAAKLTVIT